MTVAGRVESAATTLLAFDGRSPDPVLAIKIHRAKDAGARVHAEAEVLEELARIPEIGPSAPRAVFAGQIAERWVLIQTALGGTPMSGTASGDPTLALAWLERLHRARRPREDGGLRAELERTIDDLRATFELGPRELEYTSSIDLDRAASLGAVLEHGDLAPHNILIGPRGVSVIDWTDGSVAGVALHDAFFFATTANVLRASTDGTYDGLLGAFRRAYLGAGNARDRTVRPLQRHAAAIGIEPTMLDVLFGIFLIRVAVAEATRIRAAHQRGSWSSFALQVAAAEGLGPERVAEAQPWIGFFRMVAAHGPVFRG